MQYQGGVGMELGLCEKDHKPIEISGVLLTLLPLCKEKYFFPQSRLGRENDKISF